jgi:hypothetical protein
MHFTPWFCYTTHKMLIMCNKQLINFFVTLFHTSFLMMVHHGLKHAGIISVIRKISEEEQGTYFWLSVVKC